MEKTDCEECKEETEFIKESVKENPDFQEWICKKCNHVLGTVHTIHRKYLVLSMEDGVRRMICPVCFKALKSK